MRELRIHVKEMAGGEWGGGGCGVEAVRWRSCGDIREMASGQLMVLIKLTVIISRKIIYTGLIVHRTFICHGIVAGGGGLLSNCCIRCEADNLCSEKEMAERTSEMAQEVVAFILGGRCDWRRTHGQMAGGIYHVVLIVGIKSILKVSGKMITYAEFISCCRRTHRTTELGLQGSQLSEF